MRRAKAFIASCLVALGLIGTGMLAVAAIHSGVESAQPETAREPLPVAVRPIEITDGYAISRSYAGRIEPARATTLAFEIAGLVEAVFVEEGDRVTAGEVIARLDSQRLEVERERLHAQRRGIEAARELAERTESRQRQLESRGFAATQQFDEARFEQQRLAAEGAAIDAQLEAIGIDIDKSELRAPFAGKIGLQPVDEGIVVSPGTPVARLVDTDRVRARIGLPVAVAGMLGPGERYTLSAGGRSLDASFLAVSPEVEPTSRTVFVLFEVAPGLDVMIGEIVRLAIDTRVAGEGAWVPLSALQEGERGLWTILVVDRQDASVRREAVEILEIEEDRVYVRGTMADGALLITQGLNRIVEGQIVRPLLEAGETDEGSV